MHPFHFATPTDHVLLTPASNRNSWDRNRSCSLTAKAKVGLTSLHGLFYVSFLQSVPRAKILIKPACSSLQPITAPTWADPGSTPEKRTAATDFFSQVFKD